MKPAGIVYMAIGIIAIIGALGAAFVIFTLSDALNVINSADTTQLPPNIDPSTLQDSVRSLSLLITIGWAWIICVLLSGVISVYFGLATLRSKKK